MAEPGQIKAAAGKSRKPSQFPKPQARKTDQMPKVPQGLSGVAGQPTVIPVPVLSPIERPHLEPIV